MSAEVKIVPLPTQKGLGLIFFASVAEAMEATVELLDLKPAAIEHVDRVRELITDKKADLNLFGEVKWQKVSKNYLSKYIDLMSLFFDLVSGDIIKIRIMFTQKHTGGAQSN